MPRSAPPLPKLPLLAALVLAPAFALLPARDLPAQSPARLGLTLSTCTFQPLDRQPGYPVPPGLYARAGLGWLPGNRLELELFQVPRLVPEPYSEAFTGLSVGCWLFPRQRNAYFNLSADAAVLCALDGRALLSARLCPIVLGGPYYHYADRLLAVALVWDVEAARIFWQFQLVGLSVFF